LEEAEIARARRNPTESLDAYNNLLRGLAVGTRTREDLATALRFFNRAVELDPTYARAYAQAAWCYAVRKRERWITAPDTERVEAERLARRAVELSEDDALALGLAGWTLAYVVNDLESGATLMERANSINPNLSLVWFLSSWVTAPHPWSLFRGRSSPV
jgi:tetratricopeptide (TPR) repeat protein